MNAESYIGRVTLVLTKFNIKIIIIPADNGGDPKKTKNALPWARILIENNQIPKQAIDWLPENSEKRGADRG